MFFFCWTHKNKIGLFSINKCTTMVIKPLKFLFHILVMKNFNFTLVCILSLKKSDLGVPFSNDLSLEPIITYNMNTKLEKPYFLSPVFFFLSNNKVPLTF